MAIANYTTTVNQLKTIGEIQTMLVEHGVISISIDYADKQPPHSTLLPLSISKMFPFDYLANGKVFYKPWSATQKFRSAIKRPASTPPIA